MKHLMKYLTKRLFFSSAISIIFCFLLLIMPVYASGSASISISESASVESYTEPSTESSTEPLTESAVKSQSKQKVFKIDNQHVYTGMDASYHDGYTPEIKNNKAIVILPLTANRSLKDDRLAAGLDLGERADTPFIFKNYHKTFSLSSQAIKGSAEKKDIFYIRFDLSLSSSRINGVYPVGISIAAEDLEGNEIEEAFTVYVTITDGKTPNNEDNSGTADKPGTSNKPDTDNQTGNDSSDDPSGDLNDDNIGDSGDDIPFSNGDDGMDDNNGVGNTAEEKPSSQPIILITKSTCKPAAATAGKPFQVIVTLSNTSKEKAIQNMVVSVSCDSPDLTLLNDTNTIYIEKLGKGASTDITLNYQAEKNITDGRYTINLSMSYDNTNAESLSSSGSVMVSVKQPLSVEMTMPQIASSATAGDTLPLNFQVMNLGRSKIHNVRCEISGDGLYPMSTAFIGDMEPGTSGESSMNLFIGSKSGTTGDSEDTSNEENQANETNLSDEEADSNKDDILYGPTEGTVTLIYEDTNGKEYKDTRTFYLTIEKPVIQSASTDDSDNQEKASQWWISMLIAGGLLAAAGIALFVVKRKHLEEIS